MRFLICQTAPQQLDAMNQVDMHSLANDHDQIMNEEIRQAFYQSCEFSKQPARAITSSLNATATSSSQGACEMGSVFLMS